MRFGDRFAKGGFGRLFCLHDQMRFAVARLGGSSQASSVFGKARNRRRLQADYRPLQSGGNEA
jgi:hypothetical protein